MNEMHGKELGISLKPHFFKVHLQNTMEVPKRNLYVIRWTVHGSEVDEWSDEIYEVKTCGGEVEEAMSYITGDGRRDNDAMLLTDGICKDDGLYYKAFPTILQAQENLGKCHAERLKKMRHTIQSICGLDEKEYDELCDTEEIVEFPNDEGKFPPSAKVIRLSSVDMAKWIARRDEAFIKGETAVYGLRGERSLIHQLVGDRLVTMTKVVTTTNSTNISDVSVLSILVLLVGSKS